MTSSSSPLIDGESETETCLSGTESDEAYGSGHISSVSDVKTVRSGKLVSLILRYDFSMDSRIGTWFCSSSDDEWSLDRDFNLLDFSI